MIEQVRPNEIQVICPTTELAYLLMDIAEHQNCVIQRYWWRSKLDLTVEEEIQPKIFDAYFTIVVLRGDTQDLFSTLAVYTQKKPVYEKLPSLYTPLTESEIKQIAHQII